MSRVVLLANPRGFCAGVDRAIAAVQTILDASTSGFQSTTNQHITAINNADNHINNPHGIALPPVYVRRQIVHNTYVVEELSQQGACFIQELDEIPQEAIDSGIPVVFSAHGVSPSVQEMAKERGINIIDATCPLVSKVHREVQRFIREKYEVIYIGHRGHDEAVGVIGEAPDHIHLVDSLDDVVALDFSADTPLVYLSQTTLSVDETADIIAALQEKFPNIIAPPSSDICYATQNRQLAVKEIARKSDCVIVVGSPNSSNSVRLMEVAQEEMGSRGVAYRVDSAQEIDMQWFTNCHTVGITSGASVPEILVDDVVALLQNNGYKDIQYTNTITETMHFVLPGKLREYVQKSQ